MAKRALIPFFLLTISIFLQPRSVLAQRYELLESGQIIESDYIRAGNIVQVDGEIKGDAFLSGGLVTVNGKIDGDLFVVGGKVNINGEVGSSVRVLGGDVSLNGPVGRNVLLLCGTCNVTRQSTINGSLLIAGANLELSATKIGRGFRFFGSRLYLNSPIDHEAFVVADREFLLGPKASVSGDLKYTGNSEAIRQPGATVAGTISYQKIQPSESYPRFFGARGILESYNRIKPAAEFLGFLVSALIGFLFIGLFPKAFEKVALAIENRPSASFGWGILVTIIVPVTIVLFTVTIVGIPVAFVLALAAYLLWLVSTYLASFFIGRKILLSRFGERRGWALVLGLFVLYLLGYLPIFGGLIKLLIILFALGGMVLAYRQPTIYQELPLPFETPAKPIAKPERRSARARSRR